MILTPGIQNTVVSNNDSSFGMRDRQIQGCDTAEKDILAVARSQMNPAGGVFAIIIPGQCSGRVLAGFQTGIQAAVGENSRLQQDLKPVADSQAEFVGLQELGQRTSQAAAKLAGEDHSGADVVAITETAWNAQYLEVVQDLRLFQDSVQMDSFGLGAAEIECVGGFVVAIRARRTQYGYARSWHET